MPAIVHQTESAKEKYVEILRINAEIKKAERHLADLRQQKRDAIEAWGADGGTKVRIP